MKQTTQAGLVREIGRWDLIALTINIIIGAGIFGLPSRIYGLTGAWSLLATWYVPCSPPSSSSVLLKWAAGLLRPEVRTCTRERRLVPL